MLRSWSEERGWEGRSYLQEPDNEISASAGLVLTPELELELGIDILSVIVTHSSL